MIGRARFLGHAKPDGRIWKFTSRLSTVGDQIEAAVAVDVAFEQSMDAIDLIIDQAQSPPLCQRLVRLLEPDNPAGLIARADPIEIAVAIDIKKLRVNEVVPH